MHDGLQHVRRSAGTDSPTTPFAPQKEGGTLRGCVNMLAIIGGIALLLFACVLFTAPGASSPGSSAGRSVSSQSRTVTLKAKPWNNGYVHVWADIVEAPGVEAKFTDVREGTHCTRLDNRTHKLIGAPPPIYYYRVDCRGVIGYVETDQVR